MDKVARKPNFNEGELVKAIAMLFLPAVHIMEYLVKWGTEGLLNLGDYIISLCSFGPIAFVLCMGYKVGMRRNYKSLIRDGVQFLVFGLILNILRWVIPYTFEGFFLGFDFEQIIMRCLKSDIYYFVALYFITLGLLKKLNIKSLGLLMVALVMFFANTFISPFIEISNPILAGFVGNFIYVDSKSCFPLLSYFIFPTIGVVLNECIKAKNKQNIIMPIVSAISIIILIVCYFITTKYLGLNLKEFVPPFVEYKINIWGAIMNTCITLMLLSVNYYIYNLLQPIMKYILRFSSVIMPFYMIQWIFAVWIKVICEIAQIEKGTITVLIYWVITIGVTGLTIFLSQKYGEEIMRLIFKLTSKMKNLTQHFKTTPNRTPS